MKCCHLTRREFLRYAALVAATPLVSTVWEPRRASAQTAPMVAINMELVTVTETSFVVTWFTGDPTQVDQMGRLAPVPADTELLVGTSPSSLSSAFHDATPTPYHYVELTGLQPNQQYFFVAQSNGMPATPALSMATSQQAPFAFTTPAPPPGRFLFAVALSNDMHFGETVAGLATTQGGVGLPPGVMQADGRPPYTEVMTDALAREARGRGADLLIVNGDISSDARVTELTNARERLGTFGDYWVTRGNHDRIHGKDDAFRRIMLDGAPTWFSRDLFGLRVVGLDTYDKDGNGADNGALSDAQWSFLRGELGRDKDRPTLMLGHHPVTAEATLTTVPPVTFDMDRTQGDQLEQLYAATPGVFLHHSGHTHRNKRTSSPTATNVVFQEGGAIKEYPGGFALLRVFSGGYAMNFFKFKSPLALEWSERTRSEYVNLVPLYEFGAYGDRNLVVERDFSGLRSAADARAAAAAKPSAPLTAPARQRAVLAATGSPWAGTELALAGGATALALGARRAGTGTACQNGVVSNSANNNAVATNATASPTGERNTGRSGGPSSSA